MVFDYIIVGGGSAGCVLANRLSQNPQNKVLLVEAGNKDDKQEIHIPAAFSKLFKGPADWNYETEAQSSLNNRKLYWPRAKVLGGCSSMNAMIYSRGNRKDYDEWESLGNPGWNFQSVLPFFKRSENHISGDSTHHGVGGPLQINHLRSPNPLSVAFVSGCEQSGIKRNDNFNGESQDGVGLYHVTQSSGKRCSAAVAYIKPILGRSNLTIYLNTHALKIVFEGSKATGLEILKDGQNLTVKANKEIILSTGAVGSPQLLMLSGIGPKAHLDSLGIPVVADMPGVGQNLQDHLLLSLAYECTQPVSLASAESVLNIAKFLLMKKGMLTSNIGEAGAFIRTNPALERPDLQYIFGPVYYISHGFVQPKGHGFTIASCLLRPESRGSNPTILATKKM
jgi:choline dehydrogenase